MQKPGAVAGLGNVWAGRDASETPSMYEVSIVAMVFKHLSIEALTRDAVLTAATGGSGQLFRCGLEHGAPTRMDRDI